MGKKEIDPDKDVRGKWPIAKRATEMEQGYPDTARYPVIPPKKDKKK